MKFGKYLESQTRPEWAGNYLDYKALKDLIKESSSQDESSGLPSFSPRTTSLTVQRAADVRDSAEERFFQKLEAEVDKVGRFTAQLVDDLREQLAALQARAEAAVPEDQRPPLLEEAKAIGDSFLSLEKYVNLNYMGFHKILKKHDKMLPRSPCRQFYIAHLHNQPWVQGNYSDLLLVLSRVYSQLRGDAAALTGQEPADGGGALRRARRYWVHMKDVSGVKHHLMQQLPVLQFDQGGAAADAVLVNSVYLDNTSLELYHARLDKRPGAIALRLRWYGGGEPAEVLLERKTHKESWTGEHSIKEMLTLPEPKVVPFLTGEYTVEQALADRRAQGETDDDKLSGFAELFTDVQRVVEAKQLKPMLRTQYMRTIFEIPFDSTVRATLDSNIAMFKENPEDGPSCTMVGRWFRDPALPVGRTEVTRFPHAVLELEACLGEGESPPDWVDELTESDLLYETHKFSKFIHGAAALFPDMIQAVPYWVDDESIRTSMVAAAPDQPAEIRPSALDQGPSGSKPRKMAGAAAAGGSAGVLPDDEEDLRHPLLGEHPTLRLMADRTASSAPARVAPGGASADGALGLLDWWFSKPPPVPAKQPQQSLGSSSQQRTRAEAKTFFANERTYLSWLHMAVTIGTISTALLGFAGSAASGKTMAAEEGMVEFISIVLLPVAILVCGYALLVFIWRSGEIRGQAAMAYIDDRRGPLALTVVLVGALGLIFAVGLADLVALIRHRSDRPAPPPSVLLLMLLGLR